MRDEAIQLVKASQQNLVMEIERGIPPAHPSYPLRHERHGYYITKPSYTYQEAPRRTIENEYDSSRDELVTSQSSLHRFDDDYTTPDVATTQAPYPPSGRNERLEQPSTSDVTQGPPVKLRARKARDRGVPTERPRSWHASKHPDDTTYMHDDRKNMRSPGYPGSPASQPRFHLLSQPQRRSKGWYESGDLKSAIRGDVNGSKDSLISEHSQHSYRSGRLSVSSSRSSGTMSSSRGSLDNLDKPHRADIGSNRATSKRKSPSKPVAGIVTQQKNVFEKLSHHPPYEEGGRVPDAGRSSLARKSPFHDNEPRYSRGEKGDETLTSPPHARSGGEGLEMENLPEFKYCDAKIVKTNHTRDVPDPPARDISSVQAMKNYHARSHVMQDDQHTSTHNLPSSEKTRQERVFGVMSVGNSRNVVTTSVTVSPNSEKHDIERSPTYQHLRDATSYSEIATPDQKVQTTGEYDRSPEHARSGSNELSDQSDPFKGKHKYGVIWKTPQTHRRTKSSDFSSVLQNWSSQNQQPKLSVSKSKDDIVNVDQAEDWNKNVHKEPNVATNDNLPSILRSLQHSSVGQRQYKELEPKTSENYELLWFSESPRPSVEPAVQNKVESGKRDSRNWPTGYKEVDLDNQDDAFGAPDETYCNNIKDMSRKVLRVTSFTRKDLTASPSYQSFEDKRKHFLFPTQKQSHPAVIHSRSRSHGNEIDETSPQITSRCADNKTPNETRPRPKSAGVRAKHAPAHRTTPPCPTYYSRKSESLPRNLLPSYTSDESSSPNMVLSPQNRRISIDVKPELTPINAGKDIEKRKAVFEYISKAKRGGESNQLGASYVSSTSLFTSHSDETDKHRTRDSVDMSENRKPSSSHRSTPQPYMEHIGSVRKKSNFKETRAKFDRIPRTKSTSSLLEEIDEPRKRSRSSVNIHEQHANIHDTDDALNATAPVITSEHSNSEELHKPTPEDERLPLMEKIKAPPRRHPRHRYSNSSSASSATTISTLSSFSSTSSTSIGKMAALGEEHFPPPHEATGTAASVLSSDVCNKSSDPIITSKQPDVKVTVIDTKVLNTEPTVAENEPKVPDNEPKVEPKESENEVIVLETIPKLPKTETELLKDDSKTVPVQKSSKKSSLAIDTGTYRVVRGKKKTKDEKKIRSSLELQINSPVKSPEDDEKVVTKVRSSSSNRIITPSHKLPPPPPPPPKQVDEKTEKLIRRFSERRRSQHFPPPPHLPGKPPTNVIELLDEELKETATTDATVTSQTLPVAHSNGISTPPTIDTYNEVTYLLDTDSDSSATPSDRKTDGYENVHAVGERKDYENVFTIEAPPEDGGKEQAEKSPVKVTPEVSQEPLLPDVTLLPEAPPAINDQHSYLTTKIMNGDKKLAQFLTASNTKSFIKGILPTNEIADEGMRYRRRKAQQSYVQITDSKNNDTLPASSNYYKTSASKAKILNLIKEKIADGEISSEEDQDNVEDINSKKMELVLSIKTKLDELDSMKDLLQVEMRENESLGRQVLKSVQDVCTDREEEKYNSFVHDVDMIINLLLSLSGRMARVENTIQMLHPDTEDQEREQLVEKRRKLSDQHEEAKQLKANIDRRQKTVSEILAGYFNQEQFADYEHYIKMKSALIMEQRELDDKAKLGDEQMHDLMESLPDDLQQKLQSLMNE
uniref:protein Shroom3 isoform X2 n=1 Tax=Ciona intestinalis TaxID=7719 RepID=UPI00089DAD50|nr:protein Shroom3 isoform X2 [Ciona intestinalis]|eukprot:XP_018671492.1 protein Shroom3 isoform X2 [Ciona intestinalis]